MNNTKIILLENTNLLLKHLSQLLLLTLLVSTFVPFSPKMPAPGIDPSWALGLNQAVAQGLAFGKEIIFTLGPYSSIYTKYFHPATNNMMMFGTLYLAIAYWVALLCLMSHWKWYWVVLIAVPIYGMVYARDALFFSYPLLVGLICATHFVSPVTRSDKGHWLLLAFGLFTPFGLLALVKGSMLILCVISMLMCFAFFIANHRKNLALISLISPLLSLIICWAIAGQSIIDLPQYLIDSFGIAAGFTEAMSFDGNSKEVILYLFASALILLAITWRMRASFCVKVFLLSIYFIFLFISFKTGFTRHLGHAYIPSSALLLATVFLPFILNSRTIYLLMLCSLSCWYYINGHYTQISIRDNFVSTFSASWHGLKSRIQDPLWAERNFTFTMDFLQAQAHLPVFPGSTDIYSYNQSYLIASQNHWSPRPIFQSYSVFSRLLAERNKQHLLGKNSPDYIIFRVEPIDGRIPALEDGASWPLLLTRYQPIEQRNGYLFLRQHKAFVKPTKPALHSETHVLGELIHLPKSRQLLFAEIKVKPTLWGKLATLLFKPSQLLITFNLKNGESKQYRFSANMGESMFLLSPLIENTEEFSQLYHEPNDLDEKQVVSFVINNQGKNSFWNKSYILTRE